MRPRPSTVPMATRMAGVTRLLSKEYFTRKTIPRKRTNPPIQAKSFTPRNASQSIGFRGGAGGGGGTVGDGWNAGIGGTGGGDDGDGAGGGGVIAGRDGIDCVTTGGAGDATTVSAAREAAGGGDAAARSPAGRASSSATRPTKLRTAALSFRISTIPAIRRAIGTT